VILQQRHKLEEIVVCVAILSTPKKGAHGIRGNSKRFSWPMWCNLS